MCKVTQGVSFSFLINESLTSIRVSTLSLELMNLYCPQVWKRVVSFTISNVFSYLWIIQDTKPTFFISLTAQATIFKLISCIRFLMAFGTLKRLPRGKGSNSQCRGCEGSLMISSAFLLFLSCLVIISLRIVLFLYSPLYVLLFSYFWSPSKFVGRFSEKARPASPDPLWGPAGGGGSLWEVLLMTLSAA